MKQEGNTPAEKDTQKAREQMERAVDKTVEAEKNNSQFGTEEAKQRAAKDLRQSAEKDTGKVAR